jgi:hypothetical protein
MRALLWVSLVLAVIVFIDEVGWLGKSDLALVIMGIAVAVGLQAGYLLWKK